MSDWGLYLTLLRTKDALNRVIDELVTAIDQGLLYVHVYCFTIHLSSIRRLTYIQGLSPDQRRAELGRRIHQISARTGVTHTRSARWVIELSVDDALAQEASVRDAHLPLIYFLIFS